MTANERDPRVSVVHGAIQKEAIYSKRLFLGAFASEAARQLTTFFG